MVNYYHNHLLTCIVRGGIYYRAKNQVYVDFCVVVEVDAQIMVVDAMFLDHLDVTINAGAPWSIMGVGVVPLDHPVVTRNAEAPR